MNLTPAQKSALKALEAQVREETELAEKLPRRGEGTPEPLNPPRRSRSRTYSAVSIWGVDRADLRTSESISGSPPVQRSMPAEEFQSVVAASMSHHDRGPRGGPGPTLGRAADNESGGLH